MYLKYVNKTAVHVHQKDWDFATAFRVQKHFGTFEKRVQGLKSTKLKLETRVLTTKPPNLLHVRMNNSVNYFQNFQDFKKTW